MIGQKGSRSKLSAALGSDGFTNRMWEKYAAKKLWARELMEDATRAVRLGTSRQDESPYKEELELLRVGGRMRLQWHLDLANNEGWNSWRLVGVVEK